MPMITPATQTINPPPPARLSAQPCCCRRSGVDFATMLPNRIVRCDRDATPQPVSGCVNHAFVKVAELRVGLPAPLSNLGYVFIKQETRGEVVLRSAHTQTAQEDGRMLKVRRRRTTHRKAVAAVEFAFVLPVIFVLTAGTIEMCSTIFLKESVTLAA
ncbi:MAG: TadE family protein, partial [Planctomycetota bacterium]